MKKEKPDNHLNRKEPLTTREQYSLAWGLALIILALCLIASLVYGTFCV